MVFEEERTPDLSPRGSAGWAPGQGTEVGRASGREWYRGGSVVRSPADRQSPGVRWGWGAGRHDGEVGRDRWRVALTASSVFNDFLIFPHYNFCCF